MSNIKVEPKLSVAITPLTGSLWHNGWTMAIPKGIFRSDVCLCGSSCCVFLYGRRIDYICNEITNLRIMKQNTKDWIQYLSAIALIMSAIVLAFTAFLTINDVPGGVNTYIGIAVSGGLAIFGVAAYMVNQVTQFKTEVRREIETMRREEATRNGKE